MNHQKADIIVIGAGAAGLMAAGQAARCGARVLLLEKMPRPGRKLRITGKGRGNLTNDAPIEEFIAQFRHNGDFLRNTFARFFREELLQFFYDLGIRTVAERGGRIFPISNQAQDVVDVMVDWIKKSGVELVTQVSVEKIVASEAIVRGVLGRGQNKSESVCYDVERVILATGGASYPATGSTGDGFRLAAQLGHTIVPLRPALVPLETHGDVAPRLEGLSLRNVVIKLLIEGKSAGEEFGEMLFTSFGLSGPIILSLSGSAVDALRMGQTVDISIDLKPTLDEPKLDARLLRDFQIFGKRQFQTLLKELLPQKLIPVCVEAVAIPPDRQGSQISADERRRLRHWLKDFRFRIKQARPIDDAIITAGGVSTREIDPRTMASRLVKGLFFAGEIIDFDADTGGYNLQAAFSTGWVAGCAAANEIAS